MIPKKTSSSLSPQKSWRSRLFTLHAGTIAGVWLISLIGIFALYFVPPSQSSLNIMDYISSVFYAAPVVTLIIGFYSAFSFHKSKTHWFNTLLGLSLLPSLMTHWLISEQTLFLFLSLIMVGIVTGIVVGLFAGILTAGVIPTSVAHTLIPLVVWKQTKSIPKQLWKTVLIFIVFALSWEMIVLTGYAMGSGG